MSEPRWLDFGFARTFCKCAECRKCCEKVPGFLAPVDVPRIAALLGYRDTDAFARAELLASPGAIVANSATGERFRIPTLVPARGADGKRCKFLGADGMCSIHEAAPAGCAFFDTHMDPGEGAARSSEILRSMLPHAGVVLDETDLNRLLYSVLWFALWQEGRCAPGPEELRKEEAK